MQTPAHLFTTAQMIWTATGACVSGIATNKYLSKIVKAMPPLPPNATWVEKWFYASLQAITEAEPVAKS